jgi:hypothetical protein
MLAHRTPGRRKAAQAHPGAHSPLERSRKGLPEPLDNMSTSWHTTVGRQSHMTILRAAVDRPHRKLRRLGLRTLEVSWDNQRVKRYVRQVKIACDDLHYDPLNPAARLALLKLLVEDVPAGPELQ